MVEQKIDRPNLLFVLPCCWLGFEATNCLTQVLSVLSLFSWLNKVWVKWIFFLSMDFQIFQIKHENVGH